MAKVTFPASDLLQSFGPGIQEALDRRRQELLQVLGVAYLSEAQKAFQQKSRGGTGSDGIRWKGLAQSTIDRKLRRGRRNERRTHTKGGKARPPAGSVNIGVDTGLLRSSGQPGFSGSATTKEGERRTATNVFQLEERSVTVGYAREYAEYFDQVRPLLPEVTPAEWQTSLDRAAQDFLDGLFRGD